MIQFLYMQIRVLLEMLRIFSKYGLAHINRNFTKVLFSGTILVLIE